MSEENVQLARRYVEAFNAQGLEGTAHTRHPDIELFGPPGGPESGRYVGEAAVRARINEVMELGYGQFRNPEFSTPIPRSRSSGSSGREAVKEWYTRLFETFDLHIEEEELIDADDAEARAPLR